MSSTLERMPPVAVAHQTLYLVPGARPVTDTSALALALAVTAGGLATADEPPLPVPALTLAAVGGVAPCGTTTHRTLSLALETERTVTVVGAVLTAVG